MPKYEVLLHKTEHLTFEKRIELTAENPEAAGELAVDGPGQDPDGWIETSDELSPSTTRVEAHEVEETEDDHA